MGYIKPQTEAQLICSQIILEPLLQKPNVIVDCLQNWILDGTIGEKEVKAFVMEARKNPDFEESHFIKIELALLEQKERALLLDKNETINYLTQGKGHGNFYNLENRYEYLLNRYRMRKDLLSSRLEELEQEKSHGRFFRKLVQRRK